MGNRDEWSVSWLSPLSGYTKKKKRKAKQAACGYTFEGLNDVCYFP